MNNKYQELRHIIIEVLKKRNNQKTSSICYSLVTDPVYYNRLKKLGFINEPRGTLSPQDRLNILCDDLRPIVLRQLKRLESQGLVDKETVKTKIGLRYYTINYWKLSYKAYAKELREGGL